MTIAAVTGANQGLGLAVAAGLRARLTGPDDVVYLTGRDPDRVATAAAGLAAAELDVATHPLDVTDAGAVDRFAAMLLEHHGGIDLLVSNAAARIVPDRPPAAQVREFAATNNLGTTRLIRAVLPLLRPGGRLLWWRVRSARSGRCRRRCTPGSTTPT